MKKQKYISRKMVWSHTFETPEQNTELGCYQSLFLSPKFSRYIL